MHRRQSNIFVHFRELSSHSLVMVNTEGAVIACLCLRNYPNIPSVMPEAWPHVLSHLYLISDLNHRTALFVHMLVCDVRYTWEPLSNLLKTMFLSLFQLQLVVLFVLPGCEKGLIISFSQSGFQLNAVCFWFSVATLSKPLMDKYFIKIKPSNKKCSNGQMMYVAFRSNILPSISVRIAM